MSDIRPVQTHESIPVSANSKEITERDNAFHALEEDQPDVEGQPRSRIKLIMIMIALNLSLFIAALDQTITATAIPTISAQLHSAAGYTWVGGAYLLANAAAAMFWAKLSDIWGRKPLMLAAVAWFFASSIVCATAPSMKILIVGRALQGVAGGGLIQLTLITISDLFSMRQRTLYLGLLEFMWCLAGGIGPILGGVFTELVTWRWNFWVNLPVSGTTFILLLVFLDVHNPRTKAMAGIKAIDWAGSLSILGLTLMLLVGLDFGGVIFAWSSPKVICLIVFGCLMSVLFILSEKKFAKYPLMPMRVFNNTSNVACLVVTYCHGFVFIAGEYYLPLYFQSVRSASPIQSGVYILPLTVIEAITGIACGVIIHRTGRYRGLAWAGLILLTLGTGLYINISATSSLGKVIAFELVAGLGAGLAFEPPLIALQSLVTQDDVATSTATLGFVRNLATSMSIVIGGVVFQNSMSLQASHLQAAGLSQALVKDFTGGDAAANVEKIKKIADPAQRLAVREAFAWSLRNMWILMAGVAAVGAVASWCIQTSVLSKEHTETKTGLKETEEVQVS